MASSDITYTRRRAVRVTSGAVAVLMAALAGGATAACRPGGGGPAVGSVERPLEMAFTPSADTNRILASGKPLADLLETETGLKINTTVPTAYAPLIEAMGAKKVDVGWLAPFQYAVAHKNYGVEVILATVRNGSKTYPWQVVVHADSGLRRLEDLRGKRFAFGDPLSTSSYLYPAAYIKENFKTDPDKFFSQIVFAGAHDKVIVAVYNKQVDGGATYGPNVGQPESDARSRVVSSLPDVMSKVVRILEADKIPNDTVSVRKDLSRDVVDKVRTGLLKVAATADGKRLLRDLYSIDGLEIATDRDYAPLREKAQLLNIDLEVAAGIKPAPTATVAR